MKAYVLLYERDEYVSGIGPFTNNIIYSVTLFKHMKPKILNNIVDKNKYIDAEIKSHLVWKEFNIEEDDSIINDLHNFITSLPKETWTDGIVTLKVVENKNEN